MKVFIFAFLFVFTIFTQAQEPTPPVDPPVTDEEGSAGKTPFILYRKVFFYLLFYSFLVLTTCLEGPEGNITVVPCDFSEGVKIYIIINFVI